MKITREKSFEKYSLLLTEMYTDSKRGKMEDLKKYFRSHKIGNIPYRYIEQSGLFKLQEKPDREFVERFIETVQDYKRRYCAKDSRVSSDNDKGYELTEEKCIRFLKSTGNYIIKKKVLKIDYIDM